MARRADPPVTWTNVTGRSSAATAPPAPAGPRDHGHGRLERRDRAPGPRGEGERRARGGAGPAVDRVGGGVGERAAAEGTRPRPAIRRGGVDDEVHAAMGPRSLLDGR